MSDTLTNKKIEKYADNKNISKLNELYNSDTGIQRLKEYRWTEMENSIVVSLYLDIELTEFALKFIKEHPDILNVIDSDGYSALH